MYKRALPIIPTSLLGADFLQSFKQPKFAKKENFSFYNLFGVDTTLQVVHCVYNKAA